MYINDTCTIQIHGNDATTFFGCFRKIEKTFILFQLLILDHLKNEVNIQILWNLYQSTIPSQWLVNFTIY